MSQVRQVALLYTLGALGYLLMLAETLYFTDPFRFGWANVDTSPEYVEMLLAFFAPLVMCASAAALLFFWRTPSTRVYAQIVAMSVLVCTTLLLFGWGLLVLPLAVPTLLLLYRTYRVRA
jgi:hypothetical protein